MPCPSVPYRPTFAEIRRSALVVGPPDARVWPRAWRLELLCRFEERTRQLWQLDYVREVVIAGSFVEDVPEPRDIDGWFVVPASRCQLLRGEPWPLQRDLNRLDPRGLWSWLRQEKDGLSKLPMWHALRVELYFDAPGVVVARDPLGRDLRPSAFFAKTRAGRPKGVVRVTRDPN